MTENNEKSVENTTNKNDEAILMVTKLKQSKPKKSITSKFGAYISILVFVMIVFMIFYVCWADVNLINQAKNDKIKFVQNYTSSIIKLTYSDLINHKYNSFNEIISELVANNVINLVFIKDKNGDVVYTTNSSIAPLTIIPKDKPKSDKQLASKPAERTSATSLPAGDITNQSASKSVQTRRGLIEGFQFAINSYKNLFESDDIYTIVLSNNDQITIVTKVLEVNEIKKLYSGYVILAITFLILGFFSANVLAKLVTKPIQNLYIAAQKFSHKDFSYRIEMETEDELAKLAEAFNEMANDLEESYRTLEDKVKQRTRELEGAYKELKEAQVKLVHSEKMSSLGQLVAGVAHELNNPINFIYGNLEHLKNYTQDMKDLIEKYTDLEDSLTEDQKTEINDFKEEIDYGYLVDDLDDLLTSCKEGAERTRQIVLDLRNFSRLDEASLKEVNVHEGIDSTLNILHNKYKNRVSIVKDYSKDIPLISCFAGQLNQVFMNILANAAQAIEGEGEVRIKTLRDGDYIQLEFSDSGCGIAQENLNKIFDPFFTTKDVGEGTGLGLSVSYGIIEKHHGTITVESEIGKGTTFKIRLPLKWNDKKEEKSEEN